ncbi:hypothetical protein IJ182_06625, partial [bacterium]|nr:hypothetical protein [bacterium]
FNDFKIKTLTQSDAKLFNFIFKKPLIKQGTFNSDLKVNGTLDYPKIMGKLNIQNIYIPDYNVNIDNTNLNFQQRSIDVSASGEIFNEQFKLKSKVSNRLKAPYNIDDIDLYITKIDLNALNQHLREIDIDTQEKLSANTVLPKDINYFTISNAQLSADNVLLDKILLNNLTANANYDKNHIFHLNNFKFKMANGTVKGQYTFNTADCTNFVSLSMNDVDSNEFAEKLFNLKNQVTGNFNGKMDATCKGLVQEECIKTISGSGGFTINNGKMPKLGSMEYLLNAANLVKGGITGLSLNGLIDLITPLRTGEFESITGSINMKNGIISNLQIFSQGKNLNLFITGKIDLSTSIADMQIFGRLLKNTSSILGPLGNASLNALFNTIPWIDLSKYPDNTIIENINKIPGVELTNNMYRIFTVDINGDINGNDYVRSFKWVE